MNEQILLNLARRANGHPAYFMQMGPINTVFSYEGDLGAQISRDPSVSGMRLGQLSGNVGISVREQPAFSFTPLSGRDFATSIFEPINPTVFYTLFNQGHPVDQLLRMMVQSVRLSYPQYDQTYVMVNVPDRNDPGVYIRFLRFAGMARQLQIHHKLQTVKTGDTLSFKFEPDAEQLIESYSRTAEFGDSFSYKYDYEDPLGVTQIEEILKQRQRTRSTESGQGPTVSFQLRTFYEVLSNLGIEQQAFEALAARTPGFLKRIPPTERRPILRFYWPENKEILTEPVSKVKYAGKTYQISDRTIEPTDGSTAEPDCWNRDVFILLSHLYHQISLDPSKLPTQQLIQVR